MDNDKVQEVRIRKSKIRKGISRTLSTAKFESIVIHTEIEEEIEWTSLEERQKKERNWEMLLVQDFKVLHDKILEDLNLSHKRAYFRDHLDTDARPEVHSQVASAEDNNPTPVKHELDDLDGLDII